MPSKTIKFAVSVPTETFRLIELLRQQGDLGRSQAVLEALELWIRRKREQQLEHQYATGYRRSPEKVSEVEPFYRAGLSSFNQEKW